MKKSIVLTLALLLALCLSGAASLNSESVCFKASGGEAFLSINGSSGLLVNCSNNPKLGFDAVSFSGTLTISGCAQSYMATSGAYRVEATGNSCSGEGSVRLYRNEALVLEFNRSSSLDEPCVCDEG